MFKLVGPTEVYFNSKLIGLEIGRKHISDRSVCLVFGLFPSRCDKIAKLCVLTGQPYKVCLRAAERACKRGLLEYGVSLRTGWLSGDGLASVASNTGG